MKINTALLIKLLISCFILLSNIASLLCIGGPISNSAETIQNNISIQACNHLILDGETQIDQLFYRDRFLKLGKNNDIDINQIFFPSLLRSIDDASTIYHYDLYGEDVIFTHPLDYDVLRAGDLISINGTINNDRFKCYTVEYGHGLLPLKWYTTGITLINNGASSIINDTIATWNTSHITKADFFTIKITVYSKNRNPASFSWGKNTYYIESIHLDPTLKEGWPKRLPWYGGYYWGGNSEAVVNDINDDGEMEILVYMGGNPPSIYAFNPDGSNAPGFPVDVDNEDVAGGDLEVPTLGDIDNDGYKEIFVNGKNNIYIFNHNGSFRKKFTLNYSSPIFARCKPSITVLCDINNDGEMEIIREFNVWDDDPGSFNYYYLSVFNSDGDLLDGWPQLCYDCKAPDDGYYYGVGRPLGFGITQAIGNFDNDLDKEIIVSYPRNVYEDPTDRDTWHYEGRIFVFNLDGSILDGFPVDIEGYIFLSSPVVGDVDNDGYDDIVVSTYNRGLYVLNRYGNILDGWPKLTSEKISATPALADFNNDGFLEIVISTEGEPYNTYIIDYQGEIIPGWPQHTSYDAFRSPIVGDVNGDGNPDIITTAGNGIAPQSLGDGGVYAWNFDGSLIDGFPKVTEVDAQAAATIADIDGDGFIELIATSNWDTTREERKRRSSVYVWELDIEYNEETIHWPMFHHDSEHTGYYTPINKSNIHPIAPILNGPATGNIGEDCTYSVIASDPDGNQVYYWFDWGDGTNSDWIGPFDSGKTIYVNHTWNAKGSYEVKVKAEDIDGAWSFWSDPLQISISKNKPVSLLMLFLERMFNHFPFTEQMLNYFD